MTNLGIASDVNNPNFAGATDPDAVMWVKFYNKMILNTYESTLQGKPVHIEIPYIQIMTPGNDKNIVDVPVREHHKLRFPKQWAVFQNSQSGDQVVGTRVEEWPIITRSQAEDLKGFKFYTVEQIAGASDEQLQKLGMNGPTLKQKAKAFLEQAKNSAFAQQQVDELQKRDQQITDLTNLVNRLASQLEQMKSEQPEAKPKRKYTRREPQGPDA